MEIPSSIMPAVRKYAAEPEWGAASERRLAPLYFAAAVSAFSGIAYELLLATYATFLLGATVFQYSLVLSLMMASMGAGSLLAERFASVPARAFLASEMVISAVAVAALPTLYFAYAQNWFPSFLLMGFVVAMGLAIGMEIPLLGKLAGSADRLPHLLFYDYLGGFLGGLVFPLLLVPRLSLFQIAGVLAVLNATVSVGFAVGLRGQLGARRVVWVLGAVALLVLSAAGAWKADAVRAHMERSLFGIGAPQ